jgi:hypothetical protein
MAHRIREQARSHIWNWVHQVKGGLLFRLYCANLGAAMGSAAGFACCIEVPVSRASPLPQKSRALRCRQLNSVNIVGAGLLATALGQLQISRLTQRFREQARSHIFNWVHRAKGGLLFRQYWVNLGADMGS